MKNLYAQLNKLGKQIKNSSPIYLTQKDFENGTYLMNQPGYYVLQEDIIFNPNPNDDYFPRPDQTQYQIPGFTLGFFAVVAIYGENIYFDLNGHKISASREFTLQQRFFSIIELGNSPFRYQEGPGQFSTTNSFMPAQNVIVKNGKLGLSSHHGIHGNYSVNVLIEDMDITDFEFIGVALNADKNILLNRLYIHDNIKNSPVLATYSAARFVRLFAKRLLSNNQVSVDQKGELGRRLALLESEMNKTFQQVIERGETDVKLFRNEKKLPDGVVYGLLVKNPGFAVNEFVSPLDPNVVKAENIYVRKVKIENLACRTDEIVALSGPSGVGAQTDVAGAVLQILNVQKKGKYKGTVLSDVQIYLAQIALSLGIQLGKNSITQDTVDWANSGNNISSLLAKGYVYKCNGDSMFHLQKFLQMYRFDAINNLIIEKSSYNNGENKGRFGNYKAAGHYIKSMDASRRIGFTGAGVNGMHFSYCSNVLIEKFIGEKIFSKNGDAISIESIFGGSNIKLDEVELRDIKAGKLVGGKWRGENYSGNLEKYQDELPNHVPISIGISYEKGSIVDMKDLSIKDLYSCAHAEKIRIV